MPKISELVPATAPAGTEPFPIVQAGETRRTTIASLKPALEAAGMGTVTSVAVANATGISWAGGPITGTGTLTPTLSVNLQAWSGLATAAKQDADATLTALAGANWAANSLAIGSGADTVAQVTFAANTFPARSSTGNLVAKTITDAALTVLDDTTVGAMLTTLGGQPLDATLTALAGANWAANTLPIGSGADALSQVAFAANTFPARSSTGNLVAKAISDTAILAAAQPAYGTYTPTASGAVNVTANTQHLAQWLRNGDTVTVSGNMEIQPTAAADTATRLRISLPVASALANTFECCGAGVNISGLYRAIAIYGDVASDTAELAFAADSTSNRTCTYHFTYRVI